MFRNIIPTEDEVRKAAIELKTRNSASGVAKIHSLLLDANVSWTVSEKRVRKILQSEGLVRSDSANTKTIHPSSRLNKSLDVNKWTSRVEIKFFDAIKGKGLVAKEKIAKGEVLWKEDPFVLAPEWEIYDLQLSSQACSFCSTIIRDYSPLHIPCGASTTATPCTAKFCNRLCRLQADKVHPLLCPARNPASVPLLAFARKAQWLALHALAQCTSRLLLASQKDDATFDSDWEVVQSLAVLGMEERYQCLRDQGLEPDRESWRRAFDLYLQAFKEPTFPIQQKKLVRMLKKQIPQELQTGTFEYQAFLRGLGRMSLNLEAHGGLYRLHSHLNHSCTPNISVRHLDQRTALSRITVIAREEIDPGQELLITYTNPESNLRDRRRRLSEWGFGLCQCKRCVEEEEVSKDSDMNTQEADDLADQLKAGLGVL
ncbi:hypothetical protein AZE42_01349 [Rhizopogon vesiculosus]|uniref:Histone-lysine N-methyltransferase SET5 n=1 Tax=Rhizopogon vesiculosus TaxID=180088 RepID=A0A1J8PZS3_9AGAM|nr:hypothetical protein AZE42_01349 [Rhizopogon vesiculosus]